MTEEFLAQKGRAEPAASHPGGESGFQNRRTIVLPAIAITAASGRHPPTETSSTRKPRQAARLTGAAAVEKRKFTFRIDPARHSAFCQAAEERNISRQKFLTEALDAMLSQPGHAAGPASLPETSASSGGAPVLPENVAALPPPL